jgi:hypothetical protein
MAPTPQAVKDRIVNFRATDPEKAALVAAAAKRRMTVSNLLRQEVAALLIAPVPTLDR